MTRAHSSAVFVLVGCLAAGCAGRLAPVESATPGSVDVSQLWEEPDDLEARNLFFGVGGEALAPKASAPFAYVKTDKGGYSPGYDVRDSNGRLWSVKLGPEAQTEVVASRILWAIGYHQVPTYYVANWTMTGGPAGSLGPGRFRPELPDQQVVAEWSWYENEFLQTQPFKGLVAVNVLLNNWDWKTSNNKVYELKTEGATRKAYVVRDLGASLGKTSYPRLLSWLPMKELAQGSRNDVADFEAQGFIKRVEGDRVEFFYRGIHHELIDTLSKDDVVWAARLLARLSDAQWQDAFRAAGYAPDVAARFIAKIESKVAEGLQLAQP